MDHSIRLWCAASGCWGPCLPAPFPFSPCRKCRENVIAYPGTDGRSAGNRRCQTDDNGQFADSYHTNNTCITADGDMYSWSNCKPDSTLNSTVFVTYGNTLLADPGSNVTINCGQQLSLQEWQELGQDAGSVAGVTGTVAELIAMGAAVLVGG